MKKTVIAFYVSIKERIIKTWRCEVSSDIEMSDVTVPDNTMFSFFSKQKNAVLDYVQIKILDNVTVGELNMLRSAIYDDTIYCYGKDRDGSLVVRSSNKELILRNFFEDYINCGIRFEFI